MTSIDKFTITDAGRIAGVFNAMVRQRSLIGLKLRNARIEAASLVLGTNRDKGLFYLDLCSDLAANIAIVGGDAFSLRGFDQGVTVYCTGLKVLGKVKVNGAEAYRVALPESILYRQRRELFRMQIADQHTVRLRLHKTASQIDAENAEDVDPCFYGDMQDLSGGGARVILYKVDKAVLPPNSDEKSVLQFELPGLQTQFALPVHWRFANHDERRSCLTLGLEFESLSEDIADQLQQYVVRAQFASRQDA